MLTFTLVISPAILDELDEKLRLKFQVSAKDASAIRLKLTTVAVLATPDLILEAVPDDSDDNRILECALAGRADYIVSGDRHLLGLKAYAGIPILTVRQFLNVISIEQSR